MLVDGNIFGGTSDCRFQADIRHELVSFFNSSFRHLPPFCPWRRSFSFVFGHRRDICGLQRLQEVGLIALKREYNRKGAARAAPLVLCASLCASITLPLSQTTAALAHALRFRSASGTSSLMFQDGRGGNINVNTADERSVSGRLVNVKRVIDSVAKGHTWKMLLMT